MSNELPQARPFRHASDIPQQVWDALSRNEAAANIILPFAKKALSSPHDQLWIALFDRSNSVAFVLSCTKGVLGNYPIFIVPCRSSNKRQERHGLDIDDAMSALVRCLLQEVPHHRVFSVFSTAKVSRAFARAFEAQAGEEYGIRALEVPYYEAALSSCTKATFVKPDLTDSRPEENVFRTRLAKMPDLGGVQSLCQSFSETSPPYGLDDNRAELEARTMIENGQVWVQTAQRADQEEEEIVCLVATTRESANVTAVTKVFTAKEWRGHRCALRLLHRVCDRILSDPKKECVVLYVGTSDDLAPARSVYAKLGFQGLKKENIQQMSDEEKWLEIGFEPTTLGYW